MLLTLLSYDVFDSTIIFIIYLQQDGDTPLIRAVAGNHAGAVGMLLEAGADIQTNYGVSKRKCIDKYLIVCSYVCAFCLFFFVRLFDWLLAFIYV